MPNINVLDINVKKKKVKYSNIYSRSYTIHRPLFDINLDIFLKIKSVLTSNKKLEIQNIHNKNYIQYKVDIST